MYFYKEELRKMKYGKLYNIFFAPIIFFSTDTLVGGINSSFSFSRTCHVNETTEYFFFKCHYDFLASLHLFPTCVTNTTTIAHIVLFNHSYYGFFKIYEHHVFLRSYFHYEKENIHENKSYFSRTYFCQTLTS